MKLICTGGVSTPTPMEGKMKGACKTPKNPQETEQSKPKEHEPTKG